ncbi:Uncharacterised protein [Mycobacteroides abscessus subsp. abscessus]|nr:Uncharacterised protein [Mycobacteroides abscessus subsp. abscessus]
MRINIAMIVSIIFMAVSVIFMAVSVFFMAFRFCSFFMGVPIFCTGHINIFSCRQQCYILILEGAFGFAHKSFKAKADVNEQI